MMKTKILLLLLALCMVLPMAGCGENLTPSDDALTEKSDLVASTEEATGSIMLEQYYREELPTQPVAVGNRLCDQLGPGDQSKPPLYYEFEPTSEVNYDNITIVLRQTTYAINTKIFIYIVNGNGNTFYYHLYPYLEKWDDGTQTWTRLLYTPDELYLEVMRDNTSQGNVGTISFDPYYVYDSLTSGKYRFLVFCGGKTFYSPEFVLTGELTYD